MAFNSDHFNLLRWKLTLPVDSSGGTSGSATEVKKLVGFESKFFFDANDGAMVFKATVDGATTGGSKYARAELREMNGADLAAWSLSEGGTMTATLKVDEVPTKNDGSPGRVIVGQIHGQDDELVRLYWEKGTVYFMNDQAGSKNEELRFDFKNASGARPAISLGEKFSYQIEAKGDTLSVHVYADGQVYTSVTKINSVWNSDKLYFKAGLYLGVNEDGGSGAGQASFYGLDFGHSDGTGFGGLPGGHPTDPVDPVDPVDPLPPPPDLPPTPVNGHLYSGAGGPNTGETPLIVGAEIGTSGKEKLSGGDGNDFMFGLGGDDTIKGRDGNDRIYGGTGKDKIEGNDDNDIIIGGLGADTVKGGNGADTFVYRSTLEGGDTITDWRAEDRLDLTGIFLPSGVITASAAIAAGLLEIRQASGAVEIWVNGEEGPVRIASLAGMTTSRVAPSQIVLTGAHYEHDGFSYPASAILGTTSSERLIGNAASNTLTGLNGSDTLSGGKGNDVIYGGNGKDVLYGGSGKDVFVFNSSLSAGNVDTIKDFSVRDDTIWLEKDIFAKLGHVGSTIGPNAFWASDTGRAHDANDRIIYERDTGRLFYDADGSGSGQAQQIAVLDKGLALTHADFLVI